MVAAGAVEGVAAHSRMLQKSLPKGLGAVAVAVAAAVAAHRLTPMLLR